MELSRGCIVIAVAPGDYGKPRPALILQSDLFIETESLIVALMTTHLHPEAPLLRIAIQPTPANGLRQPSDVMIDKIVTLPKAKLSAPIGHLSLSRMAEVSAALALLLGL